MEQESASQMPTIQTQLLSLDENNLSKMEKGETSNCAHCGQVENLLPCFKCQSTFYCSPSHQVMDWPNHQNKCEMLAKKTYCTVQQELNTQGQSSSKLCETSIPSVNEHQSSNRVDDDPTTVTRSSQQIDQLQSSSQSSTLVPSGPVQDSASVLSKLVSSTKPIHPRSNGTSTDFYTNDTESGEPLAKRISIASSKYVLLKYI